MDDAGGKSANSASSGFSGRTTAEDSVEELLPQSSSASASHGAWPMNVLTEVIRMLSPKQIIDFGLMCTNTKVRAAVIEALPGLWHLHKARLCSTRQSLEIIDVDYLRKNNGLLLAMGRWVDEIQRTDDSDIEQFFGDFKAKDHFWQQLFFYMKQCFYLSRE